MKQTTQVRKLTEALLETSDDMLAAAVTGDRQMLEELAQRRSKMFDAVFGKEEIAEADRLFLVGAFEHIRVVDQMTRQFLDGSWSRSPASLGPRQAISAHRCAHHRPGG